MLLLTGILVGIAELIVAPAQSRGCISTRQTELDMVAGVVHTALEVDIAVTVGIEDILVGIEEFLREVGAALLLRHGDQRDLCVLHVAVTAPFQSAAGLAALVGVVEIHGKLECLREVDLFFCQGIGVRKFSFAVADGIELLTGGCTGRQSAQTCQQDGCTGQQCHHPCAKTFFHSDPSFFIIWTSYGWRADIHYIESRCQYNLYRNRLSVYTFILDDFDQIVKAF